MKSIFLGWDKPFLWQVALYLKNQYPDFNLNNTKIFCPSRRASRRLIELLTNLAEEENTALINPEIVTKISSLIDSDLENSKTKKKIINSNLAKIIWSEILEEHNQNAKENNEKILDDRISEYFSELSAEISENNISIESLKGRFSSENQNSFWEIFTKLNLKYLSKLKLLNISNTLNNFEIQTKDSNIFLIASYNLTLEEEQLLLKSNANITSLIFAPEEHKAGFNVSGILVEDYWLNNLPHINNDDVIIENSPLEEVESIVNVIKDNFKEENIKNTLTICPRDPAIIAPIINLLKLQNYHTIAPGIRPLGRTIWGGLCLNLLEFWNNSVQAFINLLSNPIIEEILHGKNNSPKELVETLRELQKFGRHRDLTLNPFINSISQQEKYKGIFDTLQELSILTPDKNLSLFSYLEKTMLCLENLCLENLSIKAESITNGNSLLTDQEDYNLLLESLESLKNDLIIFKYSDLDIKNSVSTLNTTIRNILLKTSLHPEEDNGVQILGSYEVFLDDNPFLFSTSSSEDYLPESLETDPYLPDSVKEAVGIRGRKWHLASQTYNLHTLVNSKKRVVFSVSRTNFNSEPIKLSRYLAIKDNLPNDNNLFKFYGDSKSKHKQNDNNETNLDFPQGLLKPTFDSYSKFPLRSLSPSQIRDYINCPYEFYLKHILGFKIEQDDNSELPENIFGSIIHKVIALASEEIRNITKLEFSQTYSLCKKILDKEIYTLFGKNLSIEMLLQIQAIENRLKQYVNFEIDSKNQNKKLKYIEHKIENTNLIKISSGENIPLVGIIDRTEIQEDKLIITDFKTGDDPTNSIKNALNDLQLPIYALALSKHQEFANYKIILQVVSLNKYSNYDSKDIEFNQEFSENVEEELSVVAENILNAKFWPPTNVVSRISKRLFGNFELCK